MPRKKTGNFNQQAYQNEWIKQNMKQVGSAYKIDFVDQFKAACKKLGISQSEIFRKAMQEVIEKAESE